MKRNHYLVHLVAFCIVAVSCSKQMSTTADVSLVGTWKWVRTDGGIAFNIHQTPASTGKNIDLKFTSDNKYYYFTNDSLTSQGMYSFTTEKSIVDHSDKTVIVFSNDNDWMILNSDYNNLELSDNAYDGVGSVFVRK